MASEASNGAVDMSGLRKAAVLLVSLSEEAAASVLKQLDMQDVEELSREVASLQDVSHTARDQIIADFYRVVLAKSYVDEGGLEYARALLERSVGREDATKIMQQIEQQVYQKPFNFLSKTESENLLTFIQDEHPQTIALILSHVPSSKGAEILSGLSAQKQVEVVSRIANMEQTSPEVIKEVERALEQRLAGIVSERFAKVGGVDSVAEMLNVADRATEKGILEALEADDPDLVEQIRRLMFVFEDMMLVNDRGIQAVLKEIDNDELSLALKTASDDLKQKILSNMSERAATMIRDDMAYMGPVRLADVEATQQRIVDVVRRLEDAGEIIIAGRGGEKEMVV